jgi:hypothetical protein
LAARRRENRGREKERAEMEIKKTMRNRLQEIEKVDGREEKGTKIKLEENKEKEINFKVEQGTLFTS